MRHSLPHPLDVELGAAIRKHRTAAGLSLREAALECGISDTLLFKYETGKIKVPVARIPDIAAVLGVKPLDLLQGLFES